MCKNSNGIKKECQMATTRLAQNELGEAILHITSAAIICLKCNLSKQKYKPISGNHKEYGSINPNKKSAIAALLIYEAGFHAERENYLESYKCLSEASLHFNLDLQEISLCDLDYSTTEQLHLLSKKFVINHTRKIMESFENVKSSSNQ